MMNFFIYKSLSSFLITSLGSIQGSKITDLKRMKFFIAYDRYLQIMFWRALTNYIATNSLWEYVSYWIFANIGYCYFKNPCWWWIVKISVSLIFYFSFICLVLGLNFSPLVYVPFAFCFLWSAWQYIFFFLIFIIFSFPMSLYHFTFPTAVCESSNCFTSSLVFDIFSF